MTASELLALIALTEYLPAFEENAVDSDTLRSLTEADLKGLGVAKLGHRKKILEAIAAAGGSSAGSPPPAAAPVSPALAALTAHSPAFIAEPLAEALHEPHPVLRLWAMCDSLEMLLRFLTVSLLAEKQSAGALDPKLVSSVADLIAKPTFGKWFAIARELAKTGSSLLPEFPDFFEKYLKPLISGPTKKDQATPETSFSELRNRLAHGLPRKESGRLLAHWQASFESVMAAALWIQDLSLIGRSSAPAGTSASFLCLDGIGEPIPFEVPPGMTFPETGSLWLVRGTRQIQLWPLAVFAQAATQDLGSTRRSPSAHAQIYSRQQSVWLAYTPLGAEGFCESHGGPAEWQAFQAMFSVSQSDRPQPFEVPGFEKELRDDSTEMVGRTAEIARAIAEIQARTGGLVWITGSAGMGKSFLMARLFTELEEAADAAHHVFAYRFRAGDDRRCSRAAFATFLDERLRDAGLVREGFDAKKDAKPEERLEAAFNGLPLDQHLTLLLDGLDELVRTDPKFVEEMIGSHPRVRWVCAGRPEPALVQAMRERAATDLFPDGLPPMAEDDIRGMILNKIGPLRKKLLQQDKENAGQVLNPFITLVTQRAGGLPLYVRYVIGDVLNGKYRVLDGAEDLPESLHAYHEKLLKQLGIGELSDILPRIVALLALAHEPLDEGELYTFLAHRELLTADESGQSLLARGLAALASMLKTASDPDGDTGFVLFHNSLRDHVRDSPAMANPVRLTRKALADLADAETPPDRLKKYLLRCGVRHLLDAGRNAEAERLLVNVNHLWAMSQAGVEDLELYNYWRKLGGEDRAVGYVKSVDAYLDAANESDENEIRKVFPVTSLLSFAVWFNVGIPVTECLVKKYEAIGSEHPESLRSLNNLACFLSDKGDLPGAKSIYQRTVEARERTLGPEHPDTLSSLNGLAVLLYAKGDLAGAEPILRRALEARERTLGLEHPDTLTSLNNLATLLYAQGDLTGAESIYRRVLEASERTLGPDHPDTLRGLNNLGWGLSAKGDLVGAEMLYRRALEATERTLGAEHPSTLTSQVNLATLLSDKGDLVGAEPISRQALEARERILGPEHADTLASLNCLANLLYIKGDLAGAEPIYRRMLEASERTLGFEHPATLASHNNLANLLSDQGNLPDAESIYHRVLEARERTLGLEHPDTLASLNNLAILLVAKGDSASAEQVYRRVLEARERTLGLEHPDTLAILNNLALLIKHEGDLAGAESLYRRALKESKRTLGSEHPVTLRVRTNLDGLYFKKSFVSGVEKNESTSDSEPPDEILV